MFRFKKLLEIYRFPFYGLQNARSSIIQRKYSTTAPSLPDPANLNILSESDRKEFNSYYPIVLNDIVNNKLVSQMPKLNDRLTRILNYNAPAGRKLRPYLMIATYKFFISEEDRTPENIKLMNILGWFIELMNAAYVIQDDIVDNSETRRGKPTWFKCEDVGINAVLDATLIESTCFQLLKKYFSTHRNYLKMLDAFLDMLTKTRVGLVVETATTSLDEFSVQTYNEIAEHKMGFYLLNFTTTMGTLLANREDLFISQKAGKVFNELGYLYTIQNDYMDLYGERITGKLGSDIQEGQLTWPIVLALQQATISQRKVLRENYGSYDSEKIRLVKQIYEELQILSQYEVAVNESYKRITSEIEKISDGQIKTFAEKLAKIFFRQD